MANQIANKNYWTFTKGLITEASPLLYPENASIDEANFVLNRDGSRQRRLGIDYESGFSEVSTGKTYSGYSNVAVSTFLWENPNNIPGIIFNVVQISNTLYFFDANADSSSSALHSTLAVSSAELYYPINFAAINGVLVCASREAGLFYVSVEIPGGSLPVVPGSPLLTATKNNISILIRDIFGVNDGLAVDTRPTALSFEHNYNLLNQGWTQNRIEYTYSGVADIAVGINKYPSNSDIWYVAKDAADVYQPVLLLTKHFGTSKAPLGHYIIDAFNRSDSRISLSGMGSLPTDKELGRVGCLATYSGRVFYSGIISDVSGGDIRSPNYTGYIFYSKLVGSNDDLGRCYTEADPTSEQISDVIASDGGFIVIPDANNIVALREISGGLLVFADNGVWMISGTDKGFSATDNMTKKITDIGCVSPSSITVVEGDSIAYWGKEGIYVISGDVIDGFKSSSATLTSIQTIYDSIPLSVKRNVKGVYDRIGKKIHWLYTTDENYNPGVNPYLFNKELVFDVSLQAFYKNEIDSSLLYVAGFIELTGEVGAYLTKSVVVGADSVVVGTDTVVTTESITLAAEAGIKYLTINKNIGNVMTFTFSAYNNTSFLDWETVDSSGKDYESYLVSGYELLGDSMRNKQVEYIVFHFNRTENRFISTVDGVSYDNPSSCLVQTRFDFSDSSGSGKWSSEFQAYRLNRLFTPSGPSGAFDYGYSVITTKSKVRGKGRAISYKVRSESGKDMQLLGWSVMYSGGSSV